MHFVSSYLHHIDLVSIVIHIVFYFICIKIDDLWDFLIKSFVLVFNSWEAQNLLFLVFVFSGPSRTQKGLEFLPCQFFIK